MQKPVDFQFAARAKVDVSIPTPVGLLEQGVDINVIRAWLGHVSLETTIAMRNHAERQNGDCSDLPSSRRHLDIIAPN